MSSETEPKLLAFLAGQFALRDHQLCVKVELEYTPQSGYRPDPIQTWTPASHPEVFGMIPDADGTVDESKAHERRHAFTQRLVGEVMELANNFADSYDSGTHRFTVRTHQHLGGRATFRFKLQPSFRGDGVDEGAPLEATSSGVVSQLMRHLENKERGLREMMGTFLQTMRHAVDTIRDENESLRTQVAGAHEWRQKILETIEEARSKEHDRELELAIVMGERERKDFAVKKVVNLLPVAMSAAIRKLGAGSASDATKKNGVKAAPPSPLAEAIGKLALTITDEQKTQLQTVLSMQQVITLQEAIEASLDGGSILLPTLAQDLLGSIRPGQLQMLIGIFSEGQNAMFKTVVQLAMASKDLARDAEDDKKPDEPSQPEAPQGSA